MGLRDTIKNAAAKGFAALGDVRENITYYSYVTVTYDTSTGVGANEFHTYNVFSIIKEVTTKDVVYSNYNDRQELIVGDLIAYMLVTDLPERPNKNDEIRRIENKQYVKYLVKDFVTDPVEALWEIHLRKKNG